MKLTYEVPNILVDNTKTESIVELVTKISSSLDSSGSFLVSDGIGGLKEISVPDITSSLVHSIKSISPLAVDSANINEPIVYLSGTVPVSKGGTGQNSVINNKLLAGKSDLYTFVDIKSGSTSTVTINRDPASGDILIDTNLFTTIRNKSNFLASHPANNSEPYFRSIINTDIPSELSDKIITGSFSGSSFGQFTGSFSGSGANLSDISIENFSGELGVENGGTGKSTLTHNAFLVGNGINPVNFFTGSNSDDKKTLIWDKVLNKFTFSPRATLTSNLFNGDQSITGSLYVSENISGSHFGDGSGLTNLSSSQFNDFSSDIYNYLSGGEGVFLSIVGNKIVITSSAGGLSSVFTEGNITGSGEESNKVRLKNDLSNISSITSSNAIISNNLTVNGTASIAFLETLNQSSLQIGDKYITILSGANNHTALDGAGILYGSGSTDGTTGDQGSVAYILYRGVGTDSDYLEIFPGLHISGSLSASNGITGSYAGDGSGLINIPSSSVDLSSYATLTGVSGTFATLAGVSGTFVSASQLSSQLSSYATLTGVSSSFTTPSQVTSAIEGYILGDVYGVYAILNEDNIYSGNQYISGAISASGGLTGSFSGSGQNLINLTGSSTNFPNFQNDVRAQLSAGSNLNYVTGTFKLHEHILLDSVTASFSGSGALINNLTGASSNFPNFQDDVRAQLSNGQNLSYTTGAFSLNDDIQLDSVTASFSGSGALINNLTSSNINNFTNDVRQQITATNNLSYVNGTASLNNNISLISVTASFTGSFTGDASGLQNIYPKVRFTSQSGSITVGDIVSLSATGVARCDNTSNILSNVIGIVVSSGSGGIYVQTSGEAAVATIAGSFTTGSTIYAGTSGHGVLYAAIPSGRYATQVGYISGNGDNNIIIQPRIFGQLA